MLRHAGLELMHLVMDEEVKSLAGERHQQHEQRRAHRWGKEDGYCVVDGQKVPIKRTRLRSGDHREVYGKAVRVLVNFSDLKRSFTPL